MDNEKLFNFMEKMYSEIQGMKSEMQQEFQELKQDVKELKDGQLKLETELKETRKTLYDGYIQNAEAINRVEIKVDHIAEKVSKNEIEIKVLQSTQSKSYRD